MIVRIALFLNVPPAQNQGSPAMETGTFAPWKCGRIIRIVTLLALFLFGQSVQLPAQSLTPEQESALKSMTSESAAAIVELAVQASGWQTTIDNAKRDASTAQSAAQSTYEKAQAEFEKIQSTYDEAQAEFKQAKASLDEAKNAYDSLKSGIRDPESLAKATINIGTVLERTCNTYPQLKATLDYDRTIGPHLQRIRQAKAESDAYYQEARQLREKVEQVLTLVQNLNSPASYLKNFADGKLREWIQKPFAVDGDESFVIQIELPSKETPLFAENAAINVSIEYIPQDLVVKATGIYFQYVPGQAIPKIVVDNMKVETDLKASAISKVKSLGQELLAELDLPISIKIKGNPDFKAAGGIPRGGILFDVKVGVMGDTSFEVEGTDFVLYPGNKVDWQSGKLSVNIPLEPAVPIGTTPFGFWSLNGGFGPKTKDLEFGTKISTLATPPTTVAMSVTARTQIPVKSIEVEGTLDIANISFMQTLGKIDFSKGTIEGSFKGNDTPLKAIFFAEGKFHLSREKFVADGKLKLFGQSIDDMQCSIDLRTGEAYLISKSSMRIFGAEASSTFEGQISAGFKRVQASSQVCVNVPGIAPFGDISASVTITMDSDEELPILVKVETFSSDLNFEKRLPLLTDCTPENLHKWLTESGVKAYHQLLKELANGDEQTRKLGAKMDKKARQELDKHLGITWKTGNKDLDNLGGQLSDRFKDAGGAWHDLTQGVGGAVGNLNQGALGEAKKLDPSGWRL